MTHIRSQSSTKRTTISLGEDQVSFIRAIAAEEGRSCADVLRDAMREYLRRRLIEAGGKVIEPRRLLSDEEWRSEFDAVLQRIRAGVDPTATPEELEALITEASEEARQERLARARARRA